MSGTDVVAFLQRWAAGLLIAGVIGLYLALNWSAMAGPAGRLLSAFGVT